MNISFHSSFIIHVFLTSLVIIRRSSTDSQHVCKLLESGTLVRYGFYTPAPNRDQKYFLLIDDYLCELETKENTSQTQHFGYVLFFKDKFCQQTQWFGKGLKGDYYPATAFSVAYGSDWSENLIGLTWWENELKYSLMPIGSNQFPSDTLQVKSFDWGPTFRPTVSYVVYSRQKTKFITFFSFTLTNSTPHYKIEYKVLDFNDPEVTIAEVNLKKLGNPNDFQADKTPHYYNVPRAIIQLNTSIMVKALFGIPLNTQMNGTIIVFAKEDINFRFKFHLYYCVTEEHNLSERCKNYNESTENLVSLIDCENEQIDVQQDLSTGGIKLQSTTSQMDSTSSEPPNGKIAVWVVIVIIVIVLFIVIGIVLLIVWYFMGSEHEISKTDSNKPKAGQRAPPLIEDKGLITDETMRSIDQFGQELDKNKAPADGTEDTRSYTGDIRSHEQLQKTETKPQKWTNPMVNVKSYPKLDVQRSSESMRSNPKT